MRTISHHVQAVIDETPLLGEVISERLGNSAAIARSIKKEVEKRALQRVSVQAIAMALHRLPKKRKLPEFGLKFLRHIKDITVRSDLTLFFVHNPPFSKKLFERLSAFEKSHPESVLGVTRGLEETMIVIRSDALPSIKRIFHDGSHRVQSHVSSITMHLPSASMAIPGVYYVILKTLAWEGISIVELVSSGIELTLFVENRDVERTLSTIRRLAGAR